MIATAAQEKRLCLDCPRDISDRRRDAQRCKDCSEVWAKERAKENYPKNRLAKLQYAKNRQQTPEYKQTRRAWIEKNANKIREDKRQRHREKTGYNPEGRTCANSNCRADISDRGHNAKWCKACSTPPPRTCKVCHRDISKRGSRAQFCSDECKQHHQQAKELEGYTKTCTKCNNEKQHTEFGWHNNLRRSVCKPCEVESQTERFQKFTPEQRARRNLLKRDNERSRKANLSPEEKALETIKARKAHRQRLYGPDFDEDRLYSEQEGKCAICGTPKSLEEMHLDHDHKTKRLRGFLCTNCNLKLLPRYEKFPPQHQDSPHLNAYLQRGKQL